MYADTSALVKLLVEAPERPALLSYLSATEPMLVGCGLTVTELLRVASGRHGVPQARVDELLTTLDILALDGALLRRAGLLPSPPGTFFRSADAIHVVAAMDLAATEFLTYDRRQAQAAVQAGFAVRSPGLPTGWF